MLRILEIHTSVVIKVGENCSLATCSPLTTPLETFLTIHKLSETKRNNFSFCILGAGENGQSKSNKALRHKSLVHNYSRIQHEEVDRWYIKFSSKDSYPQTHEYSGQKLDVHLYESTFKN